MVQDPPQLAAPTDSSKDGPLMRARPGCSATACSRCSAATSADIRENIARIAHALDDLTRSRVLSLPDDDFPIHLADAAACRSEERCSAGAAARARRTAACSTDFSMLSRRPARPSSAAAIHGCNCDWCGCGCWRIFTASRPGIDRVNVGALKQRAGRYQRTGDSADRLPLFALDSRNARLPRPAAADELAIAVSFLNAPCALAAMNAHAAGRTVDRQIFSEALMEASDLSHAATARCSCGS